LFAFPLEAYEDFFIMASSFHHVGAIQCETKMGPYQGVLMHDALAWQRVIGRWTPLVTLLFFLDALLPMLGNARVLFFLMAC